MSQLSFADEAWSDLAEAVEWYELREPGLGLLLAAHVEAAAELAAAHPEAGTRVDSVRRLVVKRFPYVIYYRHDADSVQVIAVLHQRQHREAALKRR